VRAKGSESIATPEASAIINDYAAQHAPVIDARLAVGLREATLKTRHWRIRQPRKIRQVHRSSFGP